jgi:tetratricopeptide (TPR) repeat protein
MAIEEDAAKAADEDHDSGRDKDDFNNAGMAASMGRWDRALESYDDILARNQSNALAWKERGYALQKLGRYDEANESYERSRELVLKVK